MTVGFHSPMPPARTGVADYSAALLRALRLHEPEFARSITVNPRAECDIDIYHSGNNPLHREIHAKAKRRPGLVVLHDAVLHHYHLGAAGEKEYTTEFVANYGEWYRGLAARFWRRRAHSAGDPEYFRYPMLRGAVEHARTIVVHNGAAERAVRQHGGDGRVVRLPHLFEAPPGVVNGWEVIRLRERLVGPALLCGVFGYLRESKRLIPVMRAVEAVRRRGLDLRLVVAGEFASGDLERAASGWLRRDWVIRLPYLEDRQFWLWAHAVDVCVNLRYPAAGETSGIGIRLMGIGKAVIVTSGEETAAIPDAACVRVDSGLAEQEMLEAALLWLAREPCRARAIGGAARRHIASAHSCSVVAAQFRAVVEQSCP